MFTDLSGSYDVVISGTGPAESFISGALAKAGKKIIHLEKVPEYGGCRKTKGINDFIEWVEKNGTVMVNKYADMETKPRNGAYSFDLIPLTIFSRDELVEVLFNSKATDSVNIYLVDGLYFMGSDGWREIPSSKSSIFKDAKLPPRQKRAVMKFVSYFFPEADYGHAMGSGDVAKKVEEYAEKPFAEFMKAMNFDAEMSGAFEYLAARAPEALKTSDAVERIKHFCESIGRYGPSPLLTLAYGAADLPQVYCRFSAVYGSAFVLDHYPEDIKVCEEGFEMNVKDVGAVKSKHLIVAPDQIFDETAEKKLLARRQTLLTKKKLLGNDRSIAVVAPGVLGNEKPVYIVQFDWATRVCQKDEYMIHVCSMCDVSEVTDKIIEGVFEDEDILLRVAFDVTEPTGTAPEGTILVESPTLDDLILGGDFFVKQSKEIVAKIGADIEFYPADTEVEIEVDEPVAEEPKTEEPVAEETKTEEPKAEEPKTEEPKAEEPVAEEPKAEEPVAEEPKTEEPKAEEPVAEVPKAEEPVAEEPKTEEPKAEEPKTEEPKAEEPVAEVPKAEEPKTEEPVAEE